MIITCKECGEKEGTKHFHESISTLMEGQNLCFECLFWVKHLEGGDGQERVRIDGKHYIIGEETDAPKNYRGFSGEKFVIRFHDGREVTTTNLWGNGDIPPHFRERMPDNAVFVNKGEQS